MNLQFILPASAAFLHYRVIQYRSTLVLLLFKTQQKNPLTEIAKSWKTSDQRNRIGFACYFYIELYWALEAIW